MTLWGADVEEQDVDTNIVRVLRLLGEVAREDFLSVAISENCEVDVHKMRVDIEIRVGDAYKRKKIVEIDETLINLRKLELELKSERLKYE